MSASETSRRVLGLALSIPISTAACATSGTGWKEARTPHFHLASRQSAAKTARLAEQLEQSHIVITELLAEGPVDSPSTTPVQSYVIPKSDLRRWSGEDALAGFFASAVDRDYLVVVAGEEELTLSVALHEMSHMIMSQMGWSAPPWFEEGYAEVLSTVRVESDIVRIGGYPRYRSYALRRLFKEPTARSTTESVVWAPLRDLIDPNDDDPLPDADLYYTRSWALVTYLLFGREGVDTGQQLMRFNELVSSGVGPSSAFESAFEEDLDGLDQAVINFVRRSVKAYELPRSRFSKVGDAELVALDAPQAQILRARLLAFLDRREEATAALEAALVDAPEHALAHGLLAALLEDSEAAQAHWRRARALAPDDAEILRLYAEDRLHRATAAARAGLAHAHDVDEARSAFVASWKLDPGDGATYFGYGLLLAQFDGRPDKGVEMMREADRLRPGCRAVGQALLELLEAEGHDDEALVLRARLRRAH